MPYLDMSIKKVWNGYNRIYPLDFTCCAHNGRIINTVSFSDVVVEIKKKFLLRKSLIGLWNEKKLKLFVTIAFKAFINIVCFGPLCFCFFSQYRKMQTHSKFEFFKHTLGVLHYIPYTRHKDMTFFLIKFYL